MTRYLDSLVIIHTNLNILNKINTFLTGWFILNFKIKIAKFNNQISEITRGFNFLGYHFIKTLKNGKIKINVYPTKTSQKNIIWVVGEKCRTFRGVSLFNLITFLKPKLLSWASYFRYVECYACFKKTDYLIFLMVKSWLLKNNKHYGKMLINEKYFSATKSYRFYGQSYSTNGIFCFPYKKYNGHRIEN